MCSSCGLKLAALFCRYLNRHFLIQRFCKIHTALFLKICPVRRYAVSIGTQLSTFRSIITACQGRRCCLASCSAGGQIAADVRQHLRLLCDACNLHTDWQAVRTVRTGCSYPRWSSLVCSILEMETPRFLEPSITLCQTRWRNNIKDLPLGSCDRALWAKYEERRPTGCNN